LSSGAKGRPGRSSSGSSTGGGDPDTRGGVLTKEKARKAAEALAEEKAEDRARVSGAARAREEAQPAGLPWRTSGSRNNPESLIDGGAITESAKHIYRHTLKNHVRDT
jgi:hypothetical protein